MPPLLRETIWGLLTSENILVSRRKYDLLADDRKYSVTQGLIPNKSLVFMAESFQADRSKGQPIKPGILKIELKGTDFTDLFQQLR